MKKEKKAAESQVSTSTTALGWIGVEHRTCESCGVSAWIQSPPEGKAPACALCWRKMIEKAPRLKPTPYAKIPDLVSTQVDSVTIQMRYDKDGNAGIVDFKTSGLKPKKKRGKKK